MTNIYIVKEGDTLWDISAKHLGSPLQWPNLWRHNNYAACGTLGSINNGRNST